MYLVVCNESPLREAIILKIGVIIPGELWVENMSSSGKKYAFTIILVSVLLMNIFEENRFCMHKRNSPGLS